MADGTRSQIALRKEVEDVMHSKLQGLTEVVASLDERMEVRLSQMEVRLSQRDEQMEVRLSKMDDRLDGRIAEMFEAIKMFTNGRVGTATAGDTGASSSSAGLDAEILSLCRASSKQPIKSNSRLSVVVFHTQFYSQCSGPPRQKACLEDWFGDEIKALMLELQKNFKQDQTYGVRASGV